MLRGFYYYTLSKIFILAHWVLETVVAVLSRLVLLGLLLVKRWLL